MRTDEEVRNYKDSGLEWLGMVPEHWESMKIKYLFSFGRGLNITKSDLVEDGIPVISYGQIHSKANTGVAVKEELLRFVPTDIASAHPENKVHIGDFIFADTSEDKEGCGNCAYIDREGIYAGYHSLVLDGKGRDNKYFAYLFKSEPWRIQIRSKASGVKVFSITQSIMGESSIILPPLTEQRTIASYLDQKVGQIDALISEKEKMVEDLKAYRSSLITETVTKGLDKEVEMKDSGVEWIGKMPKDWKLLKLKRIVNLKSGTTLTSDRILDEGKYQVFGGNGPRGYIDDYTNEGNFVLIGRQGALCGNINYANGKFWATEHAIICYPLKDIDTIWLGETLRAMNLNQYSISAAQPGLAVERINELLIPTPSISEQKEISSYLKLRIIQIESAISEQEHQLSDLKSYKSSLITEAVTGKIDLRDWQTKNHNALWLEYRTKHIWKSISLST